MMWGDIYPVDDEDDETVIIWDTGRMVIEITLESDDDEDE